VTLKSFGKQVPRTKKCPKSLQRERGFSVHTKKKKQNDQKMIGLGESNPGWRLVGEGYSHSRGISRVRRTHWQTEKTERAVRQQNILPGTTRASGNLARGGNNYGKPQSQKKLGVKKQGRVQAPRETKNFKEEKTKGGGGGGGGGGKKKSGGKHRKVLREWRSNAPRGKVSIGGHRVNANEDKWKGDLVTGCSRGK